MPSKFDIKIKKENVRIVEQAVFDDFFIVETLVKPGAVFNLTLQYQNKEGAYTQDTIIFEEQELDYFQNNVLPAEDNLKLKNIKSLSKSFHILLIKFCRWKLTGNTSGSELDEFSTYDNNNNITDLYSTSAYLLPPLPPLLLSLDPPDNSNEDNNKDNNKDNKT